MLVEDGLDAERREEGGRELLLVVVVELQLETTGHGDGSVNAVVAHDIEGVDEDRDVAEAEGEVHTA
jgi:hypothetical protein